MKEWWAGASNGQRYPNVGMYVHMDERTYIEMDGNMYVEMDVYMNKYIRRDGRIQRELYCRRRTYKVVNFEQS